MAIQRRITLDEDESRIRNFLVGAAELHGKSHSRTPILRFAGGWVRDKLLGKTSKDIDVAIDCMSGKDFYQALEAYAATQDVDENSGTQKKTLGKLGEIKKDAAKSKHLETATTKLYNLELDLVNLRTETYNEDSRNPVMEMGTAEEDAQRRDATINAMFYNLNTEEVEDLTGRGFDDLEAGMIRTPLDPEQTFRDDPLRILRLIRFACRFGFEIEANALHWMKDSSIQTTLEKKISRERILVELEKTLRGPAPKRALQIILDQGLYNTIFTIPDYKDGVVPRVGTSHLKVMLEPLEDGASNSKAQSVLDLLGLTSNDNQWRGWLICAVLPWFRQEMPAAIVKKGAPLTMAARVARDSLKIDNNSMKVIGTAEANVDEARKLAGQHAMQGSDNDNTDTSRKRQRMAFDRVETGMVIRRWGEHWRCVVSAAIMLDLSEPGSKAGAVMSGYSDWLHRVRSEQLEDVWDPKVFKPVVTGTEIFEAVQKVQADVKQGQWMTTAVRIVAEYQLQEVESATRAGAEQALREAAEDGRLNLQCIAPKKK